MLSMGLSLPSVFAIVGVPAVAVGIAMMALGRWRMQATSVAPQDALVLNGE